MPKTPRAAGEAANRLKSGACGFLTDFRDFMLQDDVINLAVGIIIGTAFVEVINCIVKDLITPFFALCGSGGNMDELFWVLRRGNGTGEYTTIEEAKKAGAVTLNFGRVIDQIINFLIISFCVFLVIKIVMALKKVNVNTGNQNDSDIDLEGPKCSKCKESVKPNAIRCPHCAVEPLIIEGMLLMETLLETIQDGETLESQELLEIGQKDGGSPKKNLGDKTTKAAAMLM